MPGQNHKFQVDKATTVLEAKSDENGAGSRQEGCGEEKGKKVIGITKQKPLVGKGAAASKKLAEGKPIEKKLIIEEKKPVAST